MAEIEFFFDCSSPWTYLGFETVQPLAAEFGATVRWRPILVGGVFNAVNPALYEQRANTVPAKSAYQRKDLADWARHVGVARLKFPPTVFPVNSVKAMRGCILLQDDPRLLPFVRRTFEAYFGDDLDISQDAVLRDICRAAGVDPDWLSAGIAEAPVKDALRANVDELIRRGGFGSPTLFLDGGDMYFGNDRIPLLRDALARGRPAD
ncbi:2-hydroxychromene-2-carboxylate isomerase [Phenylobacterium sp.]|uniref:2-hydroxychromene-2-carboxylate isomerase n=1 Tax=Phenylobacterium sp. TaxID=1871053 RepID=UPI002F404A36